MSRFTASVLSLLAVALVSMLLLAPSAARADETGDKIAEIFDVFKKRVVTVSYARTMDAGQMGAQEVGGSVLGIIVDDSGLVMISGQEFVAESAADLMSALGGGGRSAPENFRVRRSSGVEFPARYLGGDKDANVAFVQMKLDDDMMVRAVEFAAAPTITVGMELLCVGAFGESLNYARKFNQARINAEIGDGYWGLDGDLGDMLGSAVVTMDGELLGVVGQKPGPSINPMSGGLGRLLRGVTGGGGQQATTNRLLFRPSVFSSHIADALVRAQEPEVDPNAGGTTTDPNSGDTTDPNAGDTTTDPNSGDTPTDPNSGETDPVRVLGIQNYSHVSAWTLRALENQGHDVSGLTGGVVVTSLAENSRAAKAGLARLDIITGIEYAAEGVATMTDLSGVSTSDALSQFRDAIAEWHAAGAGSITVHYWRAGETGKVTVE